MRFSYVKRVLSQVISLLVAGTGILIRLEIEQSFIQLSNDIFIAGPRLRNFDCGGKSMGTPPSGGGGRQSDGHAFIIKLKLCHVKRFMLVLV